MDKDAVLEAIARWEWLVGTHANEVGACESYTFITNFSSVKS